LEAANSFSPIGETEFLVNKYNILQFHIRESNGTRLT
jgi:hypothetical protein